MKLEDSQIRDQIHGIWQIPLASAIENNLWYPCRDTLSTTRNQLGDQLFHISVPPIDLLEGIR
jgi:hypothetical protein